MNNRVSSLFSPLKVGNVVLKSRLCYPNASPHFLQGPETWPADEFRNFYANLAKSGAAYIDIAEWNNPKQRVVGAVDSIRMQSFDTRDPSTTNYLSALADEVHFYGSKLCVVKKFVWPEGYSFGGGYPIYILPNHARQDTKPVTEEMMFQAVEQIVEDLRMYKTCGYDMVCFMMDWFLNPFANKRTDKYGAQTPESAASFLKVLASRIKEELGRDFLIEGQIHGEEHRAFSVDDMVRFVNALEGYIDIVSLREKSAPLNHPSGYNFKENVYPCVEYARAIKASGCTVKVALNGAFQNPEVSNRYIADGSADLISQARGFIADCDYYQKIKEDRIEDIIPCVLCNKCHGMLTGPWISVCTVNPKFGMQAKLNRMVDAPVAARKVAIIGGGPTGMHAAMYAADRGHQVTIYEKTDKLGGQLFHSDYVSFKWPLKRFKDWMIAQCEKRENIQIVLNCVPTKDELLAQGYDTVIAATGAVANVPDVQGLKGPDGSLAAGVMTCLDTYGHEDEIGKNVVLIGGSETGVETAMHLVEKGHTVHVLTRQNELAPDAGKLHGITMAYSENFPDGTEDMYAAWEMYGARKNLWGEGLSWTLEATTTKVEPGRVTYVTADGAEHVMQCDQVVISGGMKPCTDEAIAYAGSAPQFMVIGDCEKPTNLQVNLRKAFGAASQI